MFDKFNLVSKKSKKVLNLNDRFFYFFVDLQIKKKEYWERKTADLHIQDAGQQNIESISTLE